MLIALPFFLSLVFGSEVKGRDRGLTLSDIVTFNTPSYVDGLFADTHSLGLSIQTDHLHFSGLKLINEAFVHFDPKKKLVRTLVSNEGFVGVFSGNGQVDGVQNSAHGASYTVKEGDLIVMIASWIDFLDIQKEDLLATLHTYDSTVDIGDHYLESLEQPDSLSFIIAKIVRRSDIKPTFTRLRKQSRQVSSDSFEGPQPLKPIGHGTVRLPSVVLRWSSEDDFDTTFGPKYTDTGLETEETKAETDNVFVSSDRQQRRRRDRENCIIQ